MALSIRLTESVVFLRTPDTYSRRHLVQSDAPESVVRGLLTLELQKPTRISSIEIELVANSNNNWSEGVGSRRFDVIEVHKLYAANTVFFAAASNRRPHSLGSVLDEANQDDTITPRNGTTTEPGTVQPVPPRRRGSFDNATFYPDFISHHQSISSSLQTSPSTQRSSDHTRSSISPHFTSRTFYPHTQISLDHVLYSDRTPLAATASTPTYFLPPPDLLPVPVLAPPPVPPSLQPATHLPITTTLPTQNPEVGKHLASPSQAYPMPYSASLASVKGLPLAIPLTTPDRLVASSASNRTIAKHLATVGRSSNKVKLYHVCQLLTPSHPQAYTTTPFHSPFREILLLRFTVRRDGSSGASRHASIAREPSPPNSPPRKKSTSSPTR